MIHFSGHFKEGLKMANKVIVPQKKTIMSHSFLNSGTLTALIHISKK